MQGIERRYKRDTPWGAERQEKEDAIIVICDLLDLDLPFVNVKTSETRELKRIVYHGSSLELEMLYRMCEHEDPLHLTAFIFNFLDKRLTEAKNNRR